MTVTLADQRAIALGTARSLLRASGADPVDCSVARALACLDDLQRRDPTRLAALWYASASDHQHSLFEREWNAWKRAQQAQRRQHERETRHG